MENTSLPNTLTTQNLKQIAGITGNIYQSTAVIAKRAKQINRQRHQNFLQQIEQQFGEASVVPSEALQQTLLNERIALSRRYEQLPQSVIVATHELLTDALTIQQRLDAEESSM